MTSNNTDRTAIVTAAVVGSHKPGEPFYDLSEQLHNFQYDLISEDGSNSYKFKIELVNYDDKFTSSVIHAFSKASQGTSGFIDKDTVLTSFPKLLIQWGYRDAMSEIKLAQVSDITYKFTQAKEKILIIECVDLGNWASRLLANEADGREVASLDLSNPRTPKFKDYYGTEMTISNILRNIISSLILSAPQLKLAYSRFPDEMEDMYLRILDAFIFGARKETLINTGPAPGDKTKFDEDVRVTTFPPHNVFQAIKRFFKLFDITIQYATDFENENYLQVQTSIVNEDTGEHGEVTSFIPFSQLKDSFTYADLMPPSRSKARSNLTLRFNLGANNSIDTVIEKGVRDYNRSLTDNHPNPDNFLISSDGAYLETTLNSEAQNRIIAGSTPMGVGTLLHASNENGDSVQYSTFSQPFISGNTSTHEGDSVLDFIVSLDGAMERIVDDRTAEEYNFTNLNQYKGVKTWSELLPSDQEKIKYSNLIFTLHSPKGESILRTAERMYEVHNKLAEVVNPELLISIHYHPNSHSNDFSTVFDRTSNVNLHTDRVFISTNRGQSESSRNTLPPVKSFDITEFTASGDPLLSFPYGEANSVVKYFDFKGDIRYLADLLTSVANRVSLEDNYEYLNTKAIKYRIFPIVDYLISDEEFLKKLEEHEDIDKDAILKDLESLKGQLQEVDNSLEISQDLVDSSKFISTYLNETDVENRIGEAYNRQGLDTSFDESFDTFERFLLMMANSTSVLTLFNARDENAANTSERKLFDIVSEIEGEDPETVEITPSLVYTLKGHNIFDSFEEKGKAGSQEALLALGHYYQNLKQIYEVRVKTLGIPEMDSLHEIIAPRLINLKVHDLSKETKAEGLPGTHWVSGIYRPIAISHKINSSSGYTSEFKLQKVPWATELNG